MLGGGTSPRGLCRCRRSWRGTSKASGPLRCGRRCSRSRRRRCGARIFWFVATDVARELGYRDAPQMTRLLRVSEKATVKIDTLGGRQETTIISEPGQRRANKKPRAPMRPQPHFRRLGHCKRCEVRFDPDATAFMVRETLIMGVFPNGAYSSIVAVCKKCLTDEERKELELLLLASPDQTRRRHIETTCGGCRQRIMTVAKLRKGQRWPVRACSDRCARRMRRRPAARKRWPVERKCRRGVLSMPKRSDAIYCSAACKQRAYRRSQSSHLQPRP